MVLFCCLPLRDYTYIYIYTSDVLLADYVLDVNYDDRPVMVVNRRKRVDNPKNDI